jgi:hypothetical protein
MTAFRFQLVPLVGRRARIAAARLDTYRPSPWPSGEWTDGAFPRPRSRAFIAKLKPSTNENSRTTRGTDGSSVKATWKWGTRARQIGRQNAPAQETAPAALQLTAYRNEIQDQRRPVPRSRATRGIASMLPRPPGGLSGR